jgi:hypothetical protein
MRIANWFGVVATIGTFGCGSRGTGGPGHAASAADPNAAYSVSLTMTGFAVPAAERSSNAKTLRVRSTARLLISRDTASS